MGLFNIYNELQEDTPRGFSDNMINSPTYYIEVLERQIKERAYILTIKRQRKQNRVIELYKF